MIAGSGNERAELHKTIWRIANDRWTAPFNTAMLLHRKVWGQFATLLGDEVFHADRGGTFIRRVFASSHLKEYR